MSRAAVIDIGTNTSKIHIAEIQGNQFTSIRKEKVPTKLGQGGIGNMKISDQAVKRLEEAILFFKDVCIEERCSNIMAFATAMMRNSLNGQEVAEHIHQQTGIGIQIIGGNEEADLIFKGVSSCIDPNVGQYLIMDIGGGSTEFIVVKDGQRTWQKSFQFGATTLLETFVESDPIDSNQIDRISNFLDTELADLWQNIHDVNIPLVGSSGTFESVNEMIAHRNETMSTFLAGQSNMNEIKDIQSLYASVIQSNRKERSVMRGLPAFRIDTIVTALIVLRHVFSKIHLSSVITAPYSLKEGALIKYFAEQEKF